MNQIEKERVSLLSKSFFMLSEKERIMENLLACAKESDIEVVVRGGINDDFIYGIVLEIYKVKPKWDTSKTPPIRQTKIARVDGVVRRVPIKD